jgi:hypothetical protein
MIIVESSTVPLQTATSGGGSQRQEAAAMPSTRTSVPAEPAIRYCAKTRSSSLSKARSSPVEEVSRSRADLTSRVTSFRRATAEGSGPRPRCTCSAVTSAMIGSVYPRSVPAACRVRLAIMDTKSLSSS